MPSNNYQFKIPSTQEQILNYFQEQVITSYIAPQRNKHIFGELYHNSDNTFYFGPNYHYGDDDIMETQQVVVIHDGSSPIGEDTYSIFNIIQEDDEDILSISYNS